MKTFREKLTSAFEKPGGKRMASDEEQEREICYTSPNRFAIYLLGKMGVFC